MSTQLEISYINRSIFVFVLQGIQSVVIIIIIITFSHMKQIFQNCSVQPDNQEKV